MFKKSREYIKAVFDALQSNQKAILASQCEIISELRMQTALLEKRDGELETLTGHAAYLTKIAEHQQSRSGYSISR